jgi:hypothetical protein
MNMNKNIIKLYKYKCEFEILDLWIQWTALDGWVLIVSDKQRTSHCTDRQQNVDANRDSAVLEKGKRKPWCSGGGISASVM